MRNNKKKAFSLIELMVSALVLLVVLPAMISGFIVHFDLNDINGDMIIAASHANMVIEQMRSVSRGDTNPVGSLNNITGTNWNVWAAANITNPLPPPTAPTLPVEVASAGADPLAVTVTVNWTQGKGPVGRQLSLSFSTLITVY